MLKKLLSIAALTSLLVGGLSATQANAVTANVNPANVANGGATIEQPIDIDLSEVVIPAGLQYFTINMDFSLQPSFLTPRASQQLSFLSEISLPDGTPLVSSLSSMNAPTGPTFYPEVNGNLFGTNGTVNLNYSTRTLTIPADPSGYSGNMYGRLSVEAAPGQTLPAGTYSFIHRLQTSGGEFFTASEDGLNLSTSSLSYFMAGSSFTLPTGVTSAQVNATLCADPAKLAFGDVVEASTLIDGVESLSKNHFWRTQTGYKSEADAGYRGYGMSTVTTTVTEFDIQWGLTVGTNVYQSGLTAGQTYELGFQLFNQDGVDVSGSCAPAKPAAPTLSVVSGQISATGSFTVGSSANNVSECAFYDAQAPEVLLKSANVSTNFANRSVYSCTSGVLPAGKTYIVKFRDAFQEVFSEYSDASQILLPAPGYAITSTHAGVVEAKKIVPVSTNVLPIENYSSNPSLIPDGNGGFYLLGSQQGSCPPMCGLSSVRIRKATPTALDTTFAGTGSVVLNSFTPTNGFPGAMGYFGSTKDKWALPVNGFAPSSANGATQVFFGSTTSATQDSKLISSSAVDTLCSTASAGYGVRPGSPMTISVVSSTSSEVALSIFCQKQYIIGASQTYLALPVLATMDTTTGALTLKATLGTPSAEVNNYSARFVTNGNAGSGEPVVTALITSSLVTQINNAPQPNGGTIADHSVVRFDSNLDVISTTNSAWATSGVAISSDPTLVIQAAQGPKIFGLLRLGSTVKVVSFGSTGAGTELAIDTTASEIASPSISPIGGHAVAADETVLPVSVSGVNKDAAGWVDLTTGVLTTGEVLETTFGSGLGVVKLWMLGADKNPYLILTTSSTPENMSVLKWIDLRYTAPSGPVPAVTSKTAKYSKNTPTAGAKVTLTGSNLNAVVSAKIGTNAATIGAKSATSLELTIPTASASGTVDITLTTADGDTVVDTFTYVGTGVVQTVTVAALAASVTVGDADLALSATVSYSPLDAGSAGAITWSSDTPGVCSIVANKARLLTAGTCTVKATAAASGLLLTGSGTQSTTVVAGTVVAASQTVTLTGPTKVVVDLDGFDVTASASSGLSVVYSTSTPSVCSISSAGRVVALAAGTCVLTATQAGNANWLPASKSLTITVANTPTTPLVEKGDIKKPLLLSKTGTYLKSGDTQLSWNRTKGTLAMKLTVVYIGPIKASLSFKVGSKTYTCTSSFGLLKKQSASKYLTLTAPNLCTGKTEKTQLAALKKVTSSTVVTVTVVRDMYLPTTYKKVRTKTRVLYAKLG